MWFGKNKVSYVIVDLLAEHGKLGIRVDNLISKGSRGEVRLLRNVEQVVQRRRAERASENRPKSTQNTEQGGLATAVRASDNHVLSVFDSQADFAHKFLAIWCHDWHFLENNNILRFMQLFHPINSNYIILKSQLFIYFYWLITLPVWILTGCNLFDSSNPNSVADCINCRL